MQHMKHFPAFMAELILISYSLSQNYLVIIAYRFFFLQVFFCNFQKLKYWVNAKINIIPKTIEPW